MATLMLTLLAGVCFLIWRRPSAEIWAWRLFVTASLLCFAHFMINGVSYWVPLGNI